MTRIVSSTKYDTILSTLSQAHDCLLCSNGSRAVPAGQVPPGGPDRAAPRGEPVRTAKDLHVEVILANGAHNALYSLAVDGPACEVAEATENGKGVDEVPECVEGQMRCLVDVKALEGSQAGCARRE